uniref:Elongator complex protein 6 n=1 Tax=Caligus rogercresseyi TaxID=217165 RepID=C1BQY2_CALRO|nr:UPF0405 protein TMEM103 [Caligus rogercresseyi]|eukprot:TRINITY_DN12926_c0_g1_i1.p1 TRINITY_DN12926_c0_g1~~TRINITY_DN12926_c0_g1_i1.p1  ORF type:complete len:239 (-),score=33.38 TRINITY_DN12926_c0_g1_i1:226-942(-)
MFPELHTSLRWDQFPWREGKTLTVLEKGSADASFVLTHLLSMVSKDPQLSSVLLSLEQTKGHYAALSSKTGGSSLLKHGDRMKVVEVLKHVHEFYLGLQSKEPMLDFLGSRDLSGLYTRVEQECRPNCLLMIDNISVLQELGVSIGEVIRFVHKMKDLAKRLSGSLVLIAKEDTSVGRFIAHISDYVLEVSHLKTGYSFSVTGNLAYRWGELAQDDLQYLCKDKAIHVFAKGTSSAVL